MPSRDPRLTSAPFWLDPFDRRAPFPDVSLACSDPDGLLAVGGDLSVERLVNAYQNGIFPWYNDDQPILWWSPEPRTVLFPKQLYLSRSSRKELRRLDYRITCDQAFDKVIRNCAAPRADGHGTWIGEEMIHAYTELHLAGWAHSVEVWAGDDLAGGLYGVAIGQVFFGESMFRNQTGASKAALVSLSQNLQREEFALIDCQLRSEHLIKMGATEIARDRFSDLLRRWCGIDNRQSAWPDNWSPQLIF